MQALFDAVNAICGKIQVVSESVLEFPTNLGWYAAIPILGNFRSGDHFAGRYWNFSDISVPVWLQVRKFKYGLKVLLHSKAATKTGISALAAFLLSTAMRVGPGNILGVTGAISIGGPGALFWMWLSAFFGMSTAFAESTLSQIFKEKRDGQYVGGLPFYGRRLLNNAAWAGVALSVLYIVYAFLCFPAQGFPIPSPQSVPLQMRSPGRRLRPIRRCIGFPSWY
ncbi:MAG: alanine:cation symporter family protein [Gallintestinimicrobium sp.]